MAYPVLAPQNSWYKSENILRSSFVKVGIFLKKDYIPTGKEIEIWNADAEDLGKIKCYVNLASQELLNQAAEESFNYYDNSENWYTLDIVALDDSEKISASQNCQNAFYFSETRWSDEINSDITFEDSFSNAYYFDGFELLDVSNTVNMNYMFKGCGFGTINVSNWDTKNCQLMGGIFNNCQFAYNLDVSNWNVEKVTIFGGFFMGCRSLTSVDVSKWKTTSAKKMKYMFSQCPSLTELDLSEWDLTNVDDISGMFYIENGYNDSLITIGDISKWNVSNLVKMDLFLSRCRAFQGILDENGNSLGLNLSQWTTNNLTSLNGAFYSCSSLSSIDLSGWDVTKCTSLQSLFGRCSSLTDLKLDEWHPNINTNLHYTFFECSQLKELDLSDWNTSEVLDMNALFAYCENLENLNISTWDFSKVKDMSSIFEGCISLKALPEARWNTVQCIDFSRAFRNMAVSDLDLTKLDTSSCENMTSMFEDCVNLTKLDISSWDISNVIDFDSIFANDENLRELKLFKWNNEKAKFLQKMFYNARNLTSLDLSDWNVTNVELLIQTFHNCEKLVLSGLENWNVENVKNLYKCFSNIGNELLDLSSWNPINCVSFASVFENNKKLVQIRGLENWNTLSGKTFEKMFSGCVNLISLDLSNFDTTNAEPKWLDPYRASRNMGMYMFFGVSNESDESALSQLRKLKIGPNFSLNGNGITNQNSAILPTPDKTKIIAANGKWYNSNGQSYKVNMVPDKKEATYYAFDLNFEIKLKESTLFDLCDAVRKTANSDLNYYPSELPEVILSL